MCEQAPVRRFSPLLRADRLAASAHQHTRYKTLPTRPRQQPNRYKTLPTRPKRPISASFARAGRTLYRIHPHDPQQGELCPAPSAKPGTKLSQHTPTSSPTGTKLSKHTQNCPFQPVLPEQGELCTAPSAKPGTKLSKHAPASSPPGTKLSQRPRSTAVPRKSSPSTPHTTTEPRKSSPSTPKNGVFRLFRACRANFSRSHPHQAEQRELIRAEDLTGRDDGATLKPPTPLFTVDRPRSSRRLYGRHPRPRTRAPRNECHHSECHHNETRIRLRRFNRRVGGTSALLMPPTRYVENDSRKAQASLGATSSSASPRWICPLATGVIAPSFFLFVTTTGVTVS